MFFSENQIVSALQNLASYVDAFYGLTYLVCKSANLPIGDSIEFPISQKEEEFLETYYKPDKNTTWYFRVFRTSDKSKYWLRSDYPSSGSQSTRTRKFKDAFIHPKGSKEWGWQNNYITMLKKQLYNKQKVPALDLAIWLYREREWSTTTTAVDIVNTFFKEFNITDIERVELFDLALEDMLAASYAFQETVPLWENIRARIGAPPPPDAPQEKGGTLSLLELNGIGPASSFRVELANRLNIFTGDNGLGKTFILECAWWALTGRWTGSPVYPREDASKSEPQIAFEITGASGWPEKEVAKYDWRKQNWSAPTERLTLPGLLIYARVDGAFAIWDPASNYQLSDSEKEKYGSLVLTREKVWDGLLEESGGKTRSIFNGLINDWVDWQSNPNDYPFEVLRQVLFHLSPPGLDDGDLGPLEPGLPVRIPGDRRLMPTIKHSYGDVPLVHASAAVQRIIALAYLIVWAWEEHKAQSQLIREEPQKRMVLLIDEIEAHLHPQWQRIILPALLRVTKALQTDIQIQFLITTHSPLVMVSIESDFDPEQDKFFHLNVIRQNLLDSEVVLEEPEFVRYGHVNSWLMSEVFELRHARSIAAERAIEAAKKLQVQTNVTKEEVKEINEQLMQSLASSDEFWPRWLFFAKQHGVEM